jgi:hypothetical protein
MADALEVGIGKTSRSIHARKVKLLDSLKS